MLLQGTGQGIEVHEVDLSLYRQAISLLQFAENKVPLAMSSDEPLGVYAK